MAITAKFVADFASFYAAAEQAQIKLKGIETGAASVEKALNKTADAFSGRRLIQEAALAAEAIERIGGVSKLTANELATVGAKANEAVAKLKAIGQDVPDSIQKLADAFNNTADAATKAAPPVSKLQSTFTGLVDQVKATALGFISAQAIIGGVQAGFRALTDFVSGSVESFAASEAASRKLAAALESQGNSVPGLKGQYDALAGQFQKTTVYADELVTEMQALLVQVGDVAPADMERALTAATDLASGLGVDLRTATLLVGKAFEGETGTLKKYGIVIDEAKLKTEGITAVLDAVQQKFGGQAQAEADTYAGKIKQLGNAWDDLKETVGGYIANSPILQAAIRETTEALREQTDQMGGASKETESWTDTAGKAYLANIPLVAGFVNLKKVLTEVAEASNEAHEALERMARVKPPAGFGVAKPIEIDGLTKEMRLQEEAAGRLLQAMKPLSAEHKALAVALDRVGDSSSVIAGKLEVSEIAVKKYLDQVREGPKRLKELEAAQDKAAAAGVKAYKDHQKALKDVNDQIFNVNVQMDVLVNDRLQALGDRGQKILRLTADEAVRFGLAMSGNLPVVEGLGDGMAILGKKSETGLKPISPTLRTIKLDLGDLAKSLGNLAQVSGDAFGEMVRDLATVVASIDTMDKSIDSVKSGFSGGFSFKGLLQGTSGLLGMASAAISLGKALANLFKGGANNKGRDLVKSFVDAQGGFSKLQKQIALVDDASGSMWKALTQGEAENNPEAARRAIDNVSNALGRVPAQLNKMLNAALTSGVGLDASLEPFLEDLIRTGQLTEANKNLLMGLPAAGVPAFDEVSGAAERLGLNIDSIGQNIKQMGFTDLASSVANDLDILARAGADMDAVLTGSRDKIQKLVNDAQKFGFTLPESLKPFLQMMVDSGKLTDMFGDKLEDLEDLHFAKPLEESVDDLIAALKDLIGVIRDGVGGALDDLGRKVVRPKVEVDTSGLPSGDSTPRQEPPDTPGFAGGTHGKYLDFGAGTTVRLHGRERVMTEGEGSSGGMVGTAIINLDGREIARATVPYFPDEVRRHGLA